MKMVNTLKQNKLFFAVIIVLLSASVSFGAKQNTYPTKATPVGADKALIVDSVDNSTKQANLNAMRAALGLGTTDNPSFLSVHASGGNLAAANNQVTKAWASGLPYTANVTSVIHGGKHYICTSTHTAGSTTEPGVGASWATVWKLGTGASTAAEVTVTPFSTYSSVNAQALLEEIDTTLKESINAGGASLAVENNWTAVQNFDAGLTVTGATLDFADWTSWTFGGAQIVNASGTGDNEIWPASKVISELGGKQAALVSGTNIKSINNTSLLGSGNIDIVGGTGGYVATAPTYSDETCTPGQYAFSTIPSEYKCKATNTWDYQVVSGTSLVWAGWNNPTPVSYALNLTITGASGSDSVLVAGAPYTASSTISGLLSASTTLVGSPDTGRKVACTGTAVSGTTPNYTIDMSDSAEDATCAFSATSVACSLTPFYSNTTNSYNTTLLQQAANTLLSGLRWTLETATPTICSMDWLLSSVGDVSAFTYDLELYTGGNGTSNLGTYSQTLKSGIPGSTFSSTPTFVHFGFDHSVVLTQNQVIVLRRTDNTFSGTNYLKMGTQYASGTGDWRPTSSGLNGTTNYANINHPANVKFYSPE